MSYYDIEPIGVGYITHVDTDRYYCTVVVNAKDGLRYLENVAWSSSYISNDRMSANLNIPKKGCHVSVSFTNGRFFIDKYIPVAGLTETGVEYKTGLESLREGDYCVRRGENNAFIVRESGAIEVRCTELCFTKYTPEGDRIYEKCSSYTRLTDGSQLRITREATLNDVDYELKVKEDFKSDYIFSETIGKKAGLYKLNVGLNKCIIQIDRAGNIAISTLTGGNVSISSSGNASITSSGTTTITASRINLNA